jgi:hypothetical protein
MIATACTLAALLVFDAAAAPGAAEECPLTDNRCKARLYEQKAARASTPGDRALYLHSAHRSYLFLFQKTGDVRDLCAARRTYDASLAVEGQPDAQREKFKAKRDDLVAREREHHARCESAAMRRVKRSNPSLATRQPAPASPESRAPELQSPDVSPAEPAGKGVATSPAADHPRTAGLRLLDEQPLSRAAALQPSDALIPVSAGSRVHTISHVNDPPRGRDGDPRPGRALVIAGGAMLGVGVALTAATGLMGHRMVETRQKIFALDAMVGDYSTPEQKVEGDAMKLRYDAMRMPTLALALASGTTIIVAAIMVGVGARRMARVASRTTLLPGPGGLVFRARF